LKWKKRRMQKILLQPPPEAQPSKNVPPWKLHEQEEDGALEEAEEVRSSRHPRMQVMGELA